MLIDREDLSTREQRIDAWLAGMHMVTADFAYGLRPYGKRRWVVSKIGQQPDSWCFNASTKARAIAKAEEWIAGRVEA